MTYQYQARTTPYDLSTPSKKVKTLVTKTIAFSIIRVARCPVLNLAVRYLGSLFMKNMEVIPIIP